MPEPNELKELIECLKELSKKLESPKKKDLWDKLPIFTSFLGTAVIGILTLVLTQSYQRLESNRQEKFQAAQIAAQEAQIRIEELKAITTLAPLLASKDPSTKEVGKQLLQAVSESKTPDPAPISPFPLTSESANPHYKAPIQTIWPNVAPSEISGSLIDKFAQIALASTESIPRRVEATREIGKIANNSTIPTKVRNHAVNVATEIAMSVDLPNEVGTTAKEIIANIKSISTKNISTYIFNEVANREINEIIIHHTYFPNISTYKGLDSILKMAEFQLSNKDWSKLSWHYAVAPDGVIWQGMPLNEKAIHTAKHNDNTVSVILIIDGDKEMPTEVQKRSVGILLRDLLAKFELSATENFSETRGFHRDYFPIKTCPGKNITKELILSCIKAAGSPNP